MAESASGIDVSSGSEEVKTCSDTSIAAADCLRQARNLSFENAFFGSQKVGQEDHSCWISIVECGTMLTSEIRADNFHVFAAAPC